MLEVFGMALVHIKKRPLRSVLTILQMMLGIATIAIIFNLVFGLWDGIQELRSGTAGGTYELMIGQRTVSPDGMHVTTNITTEMTITGLQRIKDEVPTVRSISPMNEEWDCTVKVDDIYYKVNRIAHVGPEFLDVAGLSMKAGTFFTESDSYEGNKVCVVASNVVGIMFEGADPIGKTLEIYRTTWTIEGEVQKGEEYTVIGVFDSGKAQGGYSRFLGNQILIPIAYQVERDGGSAQAMRVVELSGGSVATLPGGRTVTTTRTSTGVMSANEQRFQNVVLSIQEGQFASTQAALNAIVRDLYGEENEAILERVDVYVEGLSELARILSMVMGGFGLLIVVIGSIGILSTMIVNVLERTRQIGIEKALGASRGTIFLKFSAEAILMSLIGGVFGLVVAYFAWDYILTVISSLPVELKSGLHPMAVLMALFVAVVAGWIFGMYPALQASNLQPTEALRQR